MRKILALAVTSAMIFSVMGCYKKPVTSHAPTAPPESASVKYERSVLGGTSAVEAISEALVAVDATRKNLQAANEISAETSVTILKELQTIAMKNETARITCKLAADTSDPTIPWQARLLDVVAEAKLLDAKTFGIKNPQSQQAFAAAVSVFQLTIATVEASFALKSAGQPTPTPVVVPAPQQ